MIGRWLLTSIILVVARDHEILQVYLFLGLSLLFQAALLTSHPFTKDLDHAITFANEVFISLYLYLLLTLTDFNKTARDQCGLALVYTVVGSFGANFLKFIVSLVLQIRLKCAKRKVKADPD